MLRAPLEALSRRPDSLADQPVDHLPPHFHFVPSSSSPSLRFCSSFFCGATCSPHSSSPRSIFPPSLIRRQRKFEVDTKLLRGRTRTDEDDKEEEEEERTSDVANNALHGRRIIQCERARARPLVGVPMYDIQASFRMLNPTQFFTSSYAITNTTESGKSSSNN